MRHVIPKEKSLAIHYFKLLGNQGFVHFQFTYGWLIGNCDDDNIPINKRLAMQCV
jgi:hypothetical protein